MTTCPLFRPGSPTRSAGWRAAAALQRASSTPTGTRLLFEAARPVILNGIEDVVTRPDLVLTLPYLAERRRRSEQELWRGGPPSTSCGSAPVAAGTVVRIAPPAGPKTRAHSPVDCAGRRRSCGRWASTLPSAVKATPEIGSSGCVRPAKIPSAPSAACARVVAIRRRTTCAAALLVSDPNHGPGLVEPCRPVTTASRRQTRPTVLTIPAD
jgi:hypothetical protein